MKSSIYEYSNYKTYIVDLIDSEVGGGRGKRKALAEAVSCQVSHVTNVLSGDAHFSAEQAEAATRFFGLGVHEAEFFLLMLQHNRAATTSLQKVYVRLMNEWREKHSALKTRLKMPDSLKAEEEARYYSSWHFAAIHVLLSIPELQTREALASRLSLPLRKIDEVLSFLIEIGLVKKNGSRVVISRSLLHLDKSSPLISKHQSNWRLRALQSLDETADDQLHYASVFTVSKQDYPKVRETFAAALAEALNVITPSREEEAAVICLDVFRI